MQHGEECNQLGNWLGGEAVYRWRLEHALEIAAASEWLRLAKSRADFSLRDVADALRALFTLLFPFTLAPDDHREAWRRVMFRHYAEG